MTRETKRIVISFIYVLILIILVVFIYNTWLKPKPSCFDAIKNQNEEGVDCGGICAQKCALTAQQDLMVQQAGFVPSGVANNYDIYGVVSNPNQTLGSGSFSYQFTVKNAAGTVVATKSGMGFILPGETKYIVESNQAMQDIPAKVELVVSNPQWVEVNDLYEKPQLKVVQKNYSEISNGIGFSEATGLLKNESPLDFTSIKVEIILKDDQGQVVALNSTQMNTVQAGENRDFKVSWPNKFPGTVANMEVQPEVNVFSSGAFVEKYFKPAKFQQH
jgi:hypothetical protein